MWCACVWSSNYSLLLHFLFSLATSLYLHIRRCFLTQILPQHVGKLCSALMWRWGLWTGSSSGEGSEMPGTWALHHFTQLVRFAHHKQAPGFKSRFTCFIFPFQGGISIFNVLHRWIFNLISLRLLLFINYSQLVSLPLVVRPNDQNVVLNGTNSEFFKLRSKL